LSDVIVDERGQGAVSYTKAFRNNVSAAQVEVQASILSLGPLINI